MPGPHPTDRNLAALVDGRLDATSATAVRDHVSVCARCQLRVGQADTSRAIGVDMPSLKAAEVRVLDERDDLPGRGDLWRLTWDTSVLLAVVWSTDADRATILPLVDTADADDWCLLVGPSGPGGLGSFGVSVALEIAVPWSVLDARVGRLTELEQLTTLRSAFRVGADPDGVPRGEPVLTELDDRLVALDELSELLLEFANAVWAPQIDSAEAVKLDYDTLEAAGLPSNRALAISNRGATPTDAEADLIEAATGSRPEARPVAEELRRKIDQPRRKTKILQLARANGRAEALERLDLARRAEPAGAAARGTFGKPLDYDTILDRLLDE